MVPTCQCGADLDPLNVYYARTSQTAMGGASYIGPAALLQHPERVRYANHRQVFQVCRACNDSLELMYVTHRRTNWVPDPEVLHLLNRHLFEIARAAGLPDLLRHEATWAHRNPRDGCAAPRCSWSCSDGAGGSPRRSVGARALSCALSLCLVILLLLLALTSYP